MHLRLVTRVEETMIVLVDFFLQRHLVLSIGRVRVDRVGSARLLFGVQLLNDPGKVFAHVVVNVNGRLLNDVAQQAAEILLFVLVERSWVLSFESKRK